MTSNTEPRQYNQEEVRDLFLKKAKQIAYFWANESRANDPLEKIEGAFHSLFATIDGCSCGLPGFVLVPVGHEGDADWHRSQGENWFPRQDESLLVCDIGGFLHEQWHQTEL